MDQGQDGQADQIVRLVAEGRGPGGADPNDKAVQIADHQQVQRDVEEGRQIAA
ncbi:hypothetical protein D9M71_798050 [compost metagenome]